MCLVAVDATSASTGWAEPLHSRRDSGYEREDAVLTLQYPHQMTLRKQSNWKTWGMVSLCCRCQSPLPVPNVNVCQARRRLDMLWLVSSLNEMWKQGPPLPAPTNPFHILNRVPKSADIQIAVSSSSGQLLMPIPRLQIAVDNSCDHSPTPWPSRACVEAPALDGPVAEGMSGYLELVYLVTALVPSETACLASSPGSSRRTAVWISRDVMVERLL